MNYRIDEITDRGSIGDIKWFSKDFGLVLLANVFSGAVERFAVAGAHSDLAAFGGEGVGSCTTNSLTRRSYDCDSIFEPSFHVVRMSAPIISAAIRFCLVSCRLQAEAGSLNEEDDFGKNVLGKKHGNCTVHLDR